MVAEDWKDEIEAIIALNEGDMSAALDALELTSKKDFPYRLQEVQWLLDNGYDFDKFDDKLIFYIP